MPGGHSWTPSEAEQRLTAITAPWYVAAGWALDLFRGRQRPDLRERRTGSAGQHASDLAARPGQRPLPTRCLPRTARWRHLDLPARRDDPLPYSHIIQHTEDGIPYLGPELI